MLCCPAVDAPDDPLDSEEWYGVLGVCGSCIAWKPGSTEASDTRAIGVCKLRPEMGRVPADLPKCPKYMQRGGYTYDPARAGASTRKRAKTLAVVRKGEDGRMHTREVREVREVREPRPPPPRPPVPKDIDLGELTSLPVIEQALVELIRSEHATPRREMLARWKGGRIEAHDATSKVSERRIEWFFAALDRFASSLDQLESQIEKQGAKLGDTKPELEDAIARIRGTMTTFNVLFQHKEDQFKSK